MNEDAWPHMWVIALEDGEEFWKCSCGVQGKRRNPHVGQSWSELWHELAEHLVDAGQLSWSQAGSNPIAGYSGLTPQTNPLWAFRRDTSVEERRRASLEAGIALHESGE